MIRLLQHCEIECCSCNKKYRYKTYNAEALPKGWHLFNDIDTSNDGYVAFFVRLSYYQNDKHLCNDCYNIKDVLE